MEWIKVALLKRKLKSDYLLLLKLSDNYSCGSTLAEYISPDLRKLKDSINKTIKKLRKLDKECNLKLLK